ncbi:MAG: hypothetical protein KGH59_00725, partial [Candidatus Micrarchaeota archaeon]|nr:hypothetical protein [Candidatus Micrarchaeota archaeon]
MESPILIKRKSSEPRMTSGEMNEVATKLGVFSGEYREICLSVINDFNARQGYLSMFTPSETIGKTYLELMARLEKGFVGYMRSLERAAELLASNKPAAPSIGMMIDSLGEMENVMKGAAGAGAIQVGFGNGVSHPFANLVDRLYIRSSVDADTLVGMVKNFTDIRMALKAISESEGVQYGIRKKCVSAVSAMDKSLTAYICDIAYFLQTLEFTNISRSLN